MAAQTLPVGFAVTDEYVRRAQLMGNVDTSVSLTIRPIYPIDAFAWNNPYYSIASDSSSYLGTKHLLSIKGQSITLLPVLFLTQSNSRNPEGINTGSMLPNRGVQTRISQGVYYRKSNVTIQFMPEIIYAQNKYFEEFVEDHYTIVWAWKYLWWNNIDTPSRFGNSNYMSFFMGQSSVRYNFKNFSVGFSTENLWWGPGKKNSLVMSNNAPGFLHFTLNTFRPVATSIGSFETQLIAAKLDDSGFTPPNTSYDKHYQSSVYNEKRADWRYLSGLVTTWQPKWVPGLFLGFTRVSQLYFRDINSIGNVWPFYSSSVNFDLDADLVKVPNYQLSSFFFRWLFASSKAELYAEYGRQGELGNFREFIEQPNHNRAFIVGASKVYALSQESGILIDLEVTQLGQVSRKIIRNRDSWYTHPVIRHGYTHKGRIMGAGIGPGSNVQFIGINWFSGFKKAGIFIERLVHNNDFFYYAFEHTQDFRRHWVDLSSGVSIDWQFGRFLTSANLRFTRSLNYQWVLFQEPDEPYFKNGLDVSNFHTTFSFVYLLK